MKKTVCFVGWVLLCSSIVACVSGEPSARGGTVDLTSIDEQLGREREQKQTAQEEERRAEKDYARLEKRVETLGVCVLKDNHCENLTKKESCEADAAKGLCEWDNVFDQANITGCVPAMEYGAGAGQIDCRRIAINPLIGAHDNNYCMQLIAFNQNFRTMARPAAVNMADYHMVCTVDVHGQCSPSGDIRAYCEAIFEELRDRLSSSVCERHTSIAPFWMWDANDFSMLNIVGNSLCKTQSDKWKCQRKQNVPNPCPDMEKSECGKSSVCRWQKVKEQDER